MIVGAGPAGTVVASALGGRGHRVLLLDSGPRLLSGRPAPEVDRRAWAHRVEGGSFDWYRVRAVGGRALLWGGWAHRFDAAVFGRNGWPYGASTLRPFYARAERLLHVTAGELDERYRRVARELGIRCTPKRGAFLGARPWTPLDEPVGRGARAHAVALRLDRDREGLAVTLLDLRRERTTVVRSRCVVLAASPIETTRLLLVSGLGGARVGLGLVDHMVASHLLLEPVPPQPGRGSFPGAALAHGLVRSSGISVELTGPVLPSALGVERMVPPGEEERWSATQLHALGELTAHEGRYVDLDPERTDAFGRRVPRIHVAWSTAERRMAEDLRRASIAIADALATPGSKLVPFRDPLLAGGGHEAGTCAMGRDEAAPCDPWGRLRGGASVWIADASAMPTAGDRHPTLTLLAHALRAADDVGRHLSRQDGALRRVEG